MRKSLDVTALIAIFALNDKAMQSREKVGSYIQSFGMMIGERMYKNYLLNDPLYRNVLGVADTPRLIRMFSEYFSSLFVDPLDERLLERTRQIAYIHMAIGLANVHVSRGFEIVTEIVIDLSKVNSQIQADVGIILKMLRIAQSVMEETYYENHAQYQEELKKENEMLNLFDKLYSAQIIHKRSQKRLKQFWDALKVGQAEPVPEFPHEEGCGMHALIEELEPKKETLAGFGIEVAQIENLHRDYHRAVEEFFRCEPDDEIKRSQTFEQINTLSEALDKVIDLPLKDISATSFLAIHSGIEFLQTCTTSLHEGAHTREPEEYLAEVRQKLDHQIQNNLGWCIEEMYVVPGVIKEGEYDVRERITLNGRRINIAIRIKEIPNKVYMVEIVKILLEIIKQNFYNREREYALIQMVDQVEKASRSKDMFLANMSHELRTPLNAIIGFSQILKMNAAFPENFRPFIDKIATAGNNLLSLVNTILDFAKLEAGKLSFKPEMTLVSGMVHDVATIIEPMALKKSITFRYPEMISLGLYLDRQLIHQVLLNLLSNAIKFTHEGGNVDLNVEYDDVRKVYRFIVSDTGVGIDAKDIATLFDPFTQAENPFQKTAKGSGLGLAIAKRIIEDLHGGSIWVESAPGKGSSFYFTIPVSQSQNTLERFVCPNGTAAKRLLIVEDTEEYQRVLIERLGGMYCITMTNSVNRAKEVLENETYDFIILDFFLIDGISSEVLQFMEMNSIATPTIIISAEDDSKLIVHLPESENVEGIFNKAHITEICDYLSFRTRADVG
ncbi:MAG: ATP-binding protein [Sulfuricurvum sp.]